MGTATFKHSPTLDQIVSHALDSNEPVLLVHDQGLYLMTSDLRTADDSTAICAYAEGCDPDHDEDWWDAARAICGGDDFGEEFDARVVAALIRDGHGLKVDFSETHMTMQAAA